MVERQFAVRLLSDAGTPETAANIVAALGRLEGLFAKANTLGFVHTSAELVVVAAQAQLSVPTGVGSKRPSGHSWVFGGRYVGLTLDGGHLTGGTAGPAGRLSVCRASVRSTPRSSGSRLPAW